VITTLAQVRVASARQLYGLHFQDVTRRRARACLASLTARRLIARLPRVVGGARAGSSGYVFSLDVAGQRLMSPDHARPQRPWSVGRAFLDHQLSVTELYARLVQVDRAGQLRLANFTTEPACWRRFYGPAGARLVLKPDAAVRLVLGRYEDHWWIEADQGTESSTALARKCDLYRRYWQAGVEQSRIGTYPKVLWLVPDERRHAVLIDVIGRQPAEAWPLFAVALHANAVERLLQGAGL
jgi:Replication-relaxation